MKISINNKTISQVQQEFNQAFPFLRVEFFKEGHNENQGSKIESLINKPNQIISNSVSQDIIDISGEMTVFELESLFKAKFNLNVQVFRKSGNSWLETTFTDGWTLNKQNQEGFELSEL